MNQHENHMMTIKDLIKVYKSSLILDEPILRGKFTVKIVHLDKRKCPH